MGILHQLVSTSIQPVPKLWLSSFILVAVLGLGVVAAEAGAAGGACCQDDGGCTNVLDETNCPGGYFYLDAVCDTPSTNGFICNVADSCDYDHTPVGGTGLAVQVFPDLNVMEEIADTFFLPGTTGDDCLISRIKVITFHFNHQVHQGCLMGGGGPSCSDSPFDYSGLVVLIADDVDGTGTAPVCKPKVPVTGTAPFHEPLGANCREWVFGTAEAGPLAAGVQGWWWVFQLENERNIFMQFEPPIQLEKNKTYWFGFAPIMPLTGKFQTVWFNTRNYDGIRPVVFESNGAQEWEQIDFFDPPQDMYFQLTGGQAICGCGPCRLYMDLQPFYCVVDLGDVLKVLEAYAESDECSTASALGMTPGTQVWDGGCAENCITNADCVGASGIEECVNGWCCDHTDLAEILEVLDMFGDITSPTCPQVCSPGACELPAPANCCRDAGYFDSSLQNQGTTYADCCSLGGNYLGDGTTCAGSSSLPVCNTP